ncbi:MAG: hypothetical protein J5801_03250 [Bacteroidales bacterium]|nr:hypothetical protein [Bacteroidales bacterium]
MTEEYINLPRVRGHIRGSNDLTYNEVRKLFSRARLREVLTHSSYYKAPGRGNSRWVFAGMFVFKGQVAEVLHNYFTGDGTRLQHILGNLFSKERLERMFEEWKLAKFVRAGDGFDIQGHRHIFVYALFGYVSSLDEDVRNWFISKYILADDVKHLFTHRRRNRDLLHQADEIVRQSDGRRLSLQMEQTADGLHIARAVLSDGTILCEATSKSWRYARTKVTKMALNLLATPSRKALLADTGFQERERERLEREREERAAAIRERDEAREALRAKRAEERAAIARLKDIKRRQSQAEAKKRRAENAARAAAKAAKEARPMSARKRRHLEDKKK